MLTLTLDFKIGNKRKKIQNERENKIKSTIHDSDR